jgi:hypothetical protein
MALPDDVMSRSRRRSASAGLRPAGAPTSNLLVLRWGDAIIAQIILNPVGLWKRMSNMRKIDLPGMTAGGADFLAVDSEKWPSPPLQGASVQASSCLVVRLCRSDDLIDGAEEAQIDRAVGQAIGEQVPRST